MKALALAIVLATTGCATITADVHPSFLSNSFGSSMDPSDHAQANEVLEGGSENKRVAWVNPRTLKRFEVIPTRTFKRGSLDCRDFLASMAGRSVSGSACRREDGTWVSR